MKLTTIARLNMNVFCLTVFQNVQKEYFHLKLELKGFKFKQILFNFILFHYQIRPCTVCYVINHTNSKEYFQALNNMKPFSKISYEICIISAVFPPLTKENVLLYKLHKRHSLLRRRLYTPPWPNG
jgi:hypothetical protein